MKQLRAGLLLALLAIVLIATPAYADTPDPDSTPNIERINIYRNVLESDDWLIIILSNIPYSSLPDTPVTQTFIWQLLDTDEITEFGNTVGSNFNDDGYGFNVYSMYFTASEVTAKGIIWGTSYIVRLSGNPIVFDTPPIYNFPINAANYSTSTDRADVQSELTARILAIAEILDQSWGLSSLLSLLRETETATVLSTNGEAFFRGAIRGVQSMAPAVFSAVINVIELEDREWEDGYAENVTSQWSGTWVNTAQEAGKALFGTDYDLLSIIMLLAMSGGLMYGNITLTGDHWNGFIDVAVLGIIGARLGMYDLGFLMLVAAMCIFYIGAKIFFGGLIK